jgi:Right handed beta helix region
MTRSTNAIDGRSSLLSRQPLASAKFRAYLRLAAKLVLVVVGLGALASPLPAAEISTNTTGGGAWSEAATWKGKKVPGPEDEVVIAKGDTVVFDRDDDGKVTCLKLFIDPQGALKFKTNAGRITCCVAGVVESYGLLKFDGTEAAADHHELRLVGKTPDDRSFKMMKGATLQMAGRDKLALGRKNVAINARSPDGKGDQHGTFDADAGCSIDIQKAGFDNVYVQPKNIDNTGSKANERLNILSSHFTGRSILYCISCDTPVVADNVFENDFESPIPMSALRMDSCSLAEIRNNTIKGRWTWGLFGYGAVDGVTSGNTIEKCTTGVYWYGQNSMIKNTTIRDCQTGVHLTYSTGMLEETVIDRCTTGISVATSVTMQLTTVEVTNILKDGNAIEFVVLGELTLINCNMARNQIKFPAPEKGARKTPLVTAMHYLILGVKGDLPENSQVDVQTINPNPPIAPGAADLNIRNSPAPIVKGLTPLPQSLAPLILKGWMIDPEGKTVPAPEYNIRVLAPAAEGQTEAKVLKKTTVKLDDKWFRAKPNATAPTLEVTIP